MHWTELHPKDRNGTDENVIFVVFVSWEIIKKYPLEVIRGTILFLEYSCSHETQENFYLWFEWEQNIALEEWLLTLPEEKYD